MLAEQLRNFIEKVDSLEQDVERLGEELSEIVLDVPQVDGSPALMRCSPRLPYFVARLVRALQRAAVALEPGKGGTWTEVEHDAYVYATNTLAVVGIVGGRAIADPIDPVPEEG